MRDNPEYKNIETQLTNLHSLLDAFQRRTDRNFDSVNGHLKELNGKVITNREDIIKIKERKEPTTKGFWVTIGVISNVAVALAVFLITRG